MTFPPFHPGDLVLLTGGGCNRPPSELMAVWTVVAVRGSQVQIKFEPEHQTVEGLEVKGDRTFPVSWLVLYRCVDTGDEDF